MNAREGYAAALILSEGRYERRERMILKDQEQLVLEPVQKSLWIRTKNPMVVKRIKTVAHQVDISSGPLAEVMKAKLASA